MTTLPPIDRDTALRLLEKQIEEAGPDYVYTAPEESQTCQYVVDDQPSCLIGRALYDYGVPLETLAGWDAPTQVIRKVFDELAPDFLTEDAATVLAAAQETQDTGGTWGLALQDAHDIACAIESDDS